MVVMLSLTGCVAALPLIATTPGIALISGGSKALFGGDKVKLSSPDGGTVDAASLNRVKTVVVHDPVAHEHLSNEVPVLFQRVVKTRHSPTTEKGAARVAAANNVDAFVLIYSTTTYGSKHSVTATIVTRSGKVVYKQEVTVELERGMSEREVATTVAEALMNDIKKDRPTTTSASL